MNFDELKERLFDIKRSADDPKHDFYNDGEGTHKLFDRLILEYLNDDDINDLYDHLCPWCA